MTSIRISDLPSGTYRDTLAEAERRGIECLGDGMNFGAEAVILSGMADIIKELREDIEKLKGIEK